MQKESLEELQEKIKREGWIPDLETITNSNIGKLMKELQIDYSDYGRLHKWSVENREHFWGLMINKLGIEFKRKPTRIMYNANDVENVEWLKNARMNIVDSCFKTGLHNMAVQYQREGSSTKETVSYGYLLSLTNKIANGLYEAGFKQNDTIGIYMPMSIESVAIYLGIVKAGCVAVGIADSISPKEVARRLDITKTKGVFTVDYYLRQGKEIKILQKLRGIGEIKTVVVPYEHDNKILLNKNELLWRDFLSKTDTFESVARNPADPNILLFSSGTTGEPKVIPFSHLTPIKCAADAYLHHNITDSSVLSWHTSLGWIMGPLMIYSAMINNASMAIYNGTPNSREFGQFIQDANVTMLGVVPRLVKPWRETKCMEGLDWNRIELFSNTGECSNKDDMAYLMALAGNKPVIEYCGGTEIGGGYLTSTIVQKNFPAAFTTPALGLDLVILDEAGKEVKEGQKGEVYLISPWLGESQRLLNKDHHKVYYENCPKGPKGEILRRHGDYLRKLRQGAYATLGRADDTMNLGGIKTSSAEIEMALLSNQYLSEAAAISIRHAENPEQLVVYAVLKANIAGPISNEELRSSAKATIKEELNPLFASVLEEVIVIEALPRNAANKIMRRELRAEYLKNH